MPAVKANAKSDPKVYFANERTLLSWLSVATFLAISAVSLLTHTGSRSSLIAGTVMAPIAMLVALYSLARFHLRLVAIQRGSMRLVVDYFGPWVIVLTVCVMLILLVVINY